MQKRLPQPPETVPDATAAAAVAIRGLTEVVNELQAAMQLFISAISASIPAETPLPPPHPASLVSEAFSMSPADWEEEVPVTGRKSRVQMPDPVRLLDIRGEAEAAIAEEEVPETQIDEQPPHRAVKPSHPNWQEHEPDVESINRPHGYFAAGGWEPQFGSPTSVQDPFSGSELVERLISALERVASRLEAPTGYRSEPSRQAGENASSLNGILSASGIGARPDGVN